LRRYVAERKPKIRVEAGRGPVNVFFPQTPRPGEEAEVDFGEVTINLRGEPVTCMLFALRLSFSGKAVHRIFASGGTEAFLEGHVHAFTALGGVPTGKIRYDNLRAAVAQVLGFSRQRVETARWTAFRSHFTVDPFYCQPGLQGAHEKGGVEGQIGWFRRNHLVPVPSLNYPRSLRRAKRNACETSPSGLLSRSWASTSNPVSRSQAATLSGWRR
jgi:transposase